MFLVNDRKTAIQDGVFGDWILNPTKVYNVRDDKNGYPHFLIYEDGEWKYVKAKRFKPYEGVEVLIKK